MMHFKSSILFILLFFLQFKVFPKDFEVYYKTDSTKLNFKEVEIAKINDLNNWVQADNKLNFGFNSETVLVKLNFKKKTDNHYLVIENAHLDSVMFFVLENGELKKKELNGDLMPFNTRKIKSNYPVFHIERSTNELFIKMKSNGLMAAPIVLFSSNDFVNHQRQTERLYWIFSGFCLTVIIISTLFAFFLRELKHLLFGVYAFGAFFSVLHDYGYSFELFWPSFWQINQFNMAIYGLVTLAIYSFISQLVLSTNNHRLLKWTVIFIISNTFLIILINILGYYNIATQVYTYTSFINILLIYFLIIFVTFKNSEVFLRIIFLGFTLYLVFLSLYLASVLGVFEYSATWAAFYALGITMQILFFFIAVTYKVYDLKKETIDQKEKLLMLYEENSKILQNQNAKLEQKVRERTQKLAEINEEVLSQNEELQAQRSELEAVNNDLNEKSILITSLNSLLQNQNKYLEETVEKRTQEIKHALEDLTEKNSKLEQFAYVISHNLRGPIATILGLSQLFDMCDETEKIELRKKIKVTAQKLDGVIKGLSNVLDIQKNHESIKQHVKVIEIVEDVKVMLSEEIKNAKAKIIVECKDSDTLYAVPVYLNNIIYNLLYNSIKYAKKNVEPEVVFTISETQDSHVLKIQDNGIGIDMKTNHDKIFMPFKRFNEGIEGTGLGLFIIKTQMDTMKGEVEVDSEVGVGTAFILKFPKSISILDGV